MCCFVEWDEEEQVEWEGRRDYIHVCQALAPKSGTDMARSRRRQAVREAEGGLMKWHHT
jgi:hypothetical protein